MSDDTPDLATKCKNYRFYKAMKKPTCGCDLCKLKWEMKLDTYNQIRQLAARMTGIKGVTKTRTIIQQSPKG
jgi:hypothetical protein